MGKSQPSWWYSLEQVALGWGYSGKEAVSTQHLVNSRKFEGKLCLNESQRHRVLK